MIVESRFRPAPGLSNPHLQTVWASVLRRAPRVALRRERLELPDGDFLDLDGTRDPDHGPIVLLMHGLEGSSASPYAAGMLASLQHRGWRGVVVHARGCSGEPNRLPRGYHAGDTADIDWVFEHLRQREPGTPMAAIGYSLGGSVLLNWLAGAEPTPPLAAAVAVSVPFDLDVSAQRLGTGFSRLYQRHLLQRLYRSLERKHRRMKHPLAAGIRHRPATFRAFDDAYTGPLHGFDGVDDYYRRASCRPKLHRIRTATLIIQAQDDPFLDPSALPTDMELSPATTLELARRGGHVGFVSGSFWRPRYWLEERVPEYLADLLGHATP